VSSCGSSISRFLLFIRRCDYLAETRTECEVSSYYDAEHMRWEWPSDTLKTKALHKHKTQSLNLSSDLTLISVFSKDGADVTAKYQRHRRHSKQRQSAASTYSVRLDSMALQCIEIQKEIEEMLEDIHDIKTQMNNERQRSTFVINAKFFG